METTENRISRFLDFNIFWGSNLPQETPTGSRLWRSQYFPLFRNIRIRTALLKTQLRARLSSGPLERYSYVRKILDFTDGVILASYRCIEKDN